LNKVKVYSFYEFINSQYELAFAFATEDYIESISAKKVSGYYIEMDRELLNESGYIKFTSALDIIRNKVITSNNSDYSSGG